MYNNNCVCPFCRKYFTPDHYIVCQINHNTASLRHNNVVKAIANLISENKKCKVVCVAENNQESSGLKPDLECGKRHLIDENIICIPRGK